MLLEGSCHCQAVTFRVEAPHPYPFNRCYCSICRKTAGSGGYAINLGAKAASLEVTGQEHISVYQARIDGKQSPAQRSFCKHCATTLWVFDPRWPDLIHPFASAVDTPLPVPPETTHLMLDDKREWVMLDEREDDRFYAGYPEESLEDWHKRLGLEC